MTTTISTEERNRLFDTFARPNLDFIARLVRSRTFPSEDPDDNLQEALIHILLHIHLFCPDTATFRQWVSTVVDNKLKMIHRHEASLHRFFAPAPEEEPQQSTSAPVPGALTPVPGAPAPVPGAFASGSTQAAAAPSALPPLPALDCAAPIDPEDYPSTFSALMRLPASQRNVLLLTAEGWTPADIAADYGLTPSAVSALLFRARSTMKKYKAQP